MSIFENWEEEEGSPAINIDESGATVVLIYRALNAYVFAQMPDIRSTYPGEYTQFADTRLMNISYKRGSGGKWWIITLTYQSPQKGGGASYPEERKDNGTKVYLSDGAIEKPIETHPNYIMRWNYSLAKKTGTTASRPADWSTATEDTISGEGDWAWVKDRTDLGADWEIDQPALKKGKENYLLPAPIVHERSYYTKYASAVTAAPATGTRKVPSNTFGKPALDTNWLVVGSTIDYEDGLWYIDVQYQYADEVDTDIYTT